MHRLVGLLCLAVLARAEMWRDLPQGDGGGTTQGDSCRCEFSGGPDDGSVALLASRLDGHDQYLQELEQELEQMVKEDKHRFRETDRLQMGVTSDEARVTHLEGESCPEDDFQCNISDSFCIGHLAVCDGYRDCPGGEDEAPETCRNPVPLGAVFELALEHGKRASCAQFDINFIKSIILSVERTKTLPSLVHVKIGYLIDVTTNDVPLAAMVSTDGYYSFGKRTMVNYIPPDQLGVNDDIMGRTIFDTGDDRRPRVQYFHHGSGDPCTADFYIQRVD